ncbi:MAG TPA: DUF2239 family protein [Dokdonella sp.]
MGESVPFSCTAFSGTRRLATGSLLEIALSAKTLLDADRSASVQVFDDRDGTPIDLDLSGGKAGVRKRYASVTRTDADPAPQSADDPVKRGRGRPKLGVVAREVTLLPRHWDWLARQPGGASVSLRKLVEVARRSHAAADRRRHAQEATYRVMMAMAGDASGFEEATRALFAADRQTFARRIAAWPADIHDYLERLAAAAFAPNPGERAASVCDD